MVDRSIGSLGYFLFRWVVHNWSIKGCGTCCPICGKVYINDPLLLIGKSSLCGKRRFPLKKYVTMTICLTSYHVTSFQPFTDILSRDLSLQPFTNRHLPRDLTSAIHRHPITWPHFSHSQVTWPLTLAIQRQLFYHVISHFSNFSYLVTSHFSHSGAGILSRELSLKQFTENHPITWPLTSAIHGQVLSCAYIVISANHD